MAQGDVVFFDSFLLDLCKSNDAATKHHFGTTPDTVMCAIVDSTITPTSATVIPTWGAAGTVDLSANEVTVAGDYTAGGNECATPTAALSGGLVEIDFGNPTAWATGTDTDAKWGIIYNDTNTNKTCIGFVDLGTAFDMSTGTLTITWGTPVATLNQA